MRIALVGEGTYPVLHGGVSTWCDQLIRTIPEHEFAVVTLTGKQQDSVWELPSNVASFTPVPMWAQARRRWLAWRTPLEQARVSTAYRRLWSAVLPPCGGAPDHARAAAALRMLTETFTQPLIALFEGGAGTRALMNAWARHTEGTRLPPMTGAHAAEVTRHTDRYLAVLGAQWPQADLIHLTTNGPAALMALGRHWRDGTPMVMTEHGVYLRERYLALRAASYPWPVRFALMALTRAICQLAYESSAVITPVSDFNARWEEQLGADPERVITVPNGVDPAAFPPVVGEPEVPTVSFVGRIDPLKDLATLIEAFALVRERVPAARLRLFGPTPLGNESYKAGLDALVAQHGLGGSVAFEGAVKGARPAIEAGHVVALSSISEGLPYTVIESMMCGRATVSTDVGGVNECVGRDESCGLLVPPRAAQAMGEALARVLVEHDLRRRMGRNARARALSTFNLDTFSDRYRRIYRAASGQGGELDLAALRVALTAPPAEPTHAVPVSSYAGVA